MDMKSLPKLGASKKRTRRGKWSPHSSNIDEPEMMSSVAVHPKVRTPIDIKGKAAGLSSKWINARNAHETRQIARYTQKANVQSARANLEEQRARIRKARRSGRGHGELKRPFQGKIKYKGDRDD